MTSTYALPNTHTAAETRLDSLSALYDPVTAATVTATGVDKDWACLEVGAGNGSVARWLAGRAREVIATDVDLRWFDHGDVPRNLTPLRHDVTADPLPVDYFDLVHARLVVMHLSDPDDVLTTLVTATRPGGWVVVEELDPLTPYVPCERTDTDRVVNTVGTAFARYMADHGADNLRGHRACQLLTDAGLVDVTNHGHVVVATPDSPAVDLMVANIDQVGTELVEAGYVTADEVTHYLAALTSPDPPTFLLPVFFSARGRRP